MSFGKKVLTGVAAGLVVVVAQFTVGRNVADRINDSGATDTAVDWFLGLDWWRILEATGLGLWVLLAVANVVCLARWMRPYLADDVLYANTDVLAFFAVTSSLVSVMTAWFLVPDHKWVPVIAATVVVAGATARWRVKRVVRRRALEYYEYLAEKYASKPELEPDPGAESESESEKGSEAKALAMAIGIQRARAAQPGTPEAAAVKAAAAENEARERQAREDAAVRRSWAEFEGAERRERERYGLWP